jgi:hypothetical protein
MYRLKGRYRRQAGSYRLTTLPITSFRPLATTEPAGFFADPLCLTSPLQTPPLKPVHTHGILRAYTCGDGLLKGRPI